MRDFVSSLIAGLLFGAGLVISGMANPDNVLGFLTLDTAWNPSLALVMGGALAITVPGFAWINQRHRLLDETAFTPVPHARIDYKLIIGAILFGLGWGLSGYCPGPALVSAALGHVDALILLAAMISGAALAKISTR